VGNTCGIIFNIHIRNFIKMTELILQIKNENTLRTIFETITVAGTMIFPLLLPILVIYGSTI